RRSPGSARVGRSAAAARYSPGRAWMRAAVMSCTEPGSTSETHSGNPLGAMTAWMLPPWACALPEYHRSMTSPWTLLPSLLSQFLSHSFPSGTVHQRSLGSCLCRSRTVADGGERWPALLESVLGATPQEFESPILRHL